jgi:hypothetical protein
MKISRTKLHQIIKEEVASLAEGTNSRTVRMDGEPRSIEKTRKKPKSAQPREEDPIDAAARQNRERVAAARAMRGSTEPLSVTKTKYEPRRGPKQRRADQDRAAAKDFFGSDDPLVTKVDDPDKTQAPAVDPDKTIARSPEEMAARAAELDAAEPKQATDRQLNDPQRLVITAFDSDVRAKLLETYASEAAIEIDERPLGHGEFGIVYEGENPEYGPVAIKMTLSGQEIGAYKNIKRLKDGLESRDPEAGNVLPTILDIRTIVSPPVGPEGDIRPGRYIEKEDGRPYKVFVVQMELLEKLDNNTRADIFSPAPMGEYSPPVMKRFVEEYLTVENIYSSLEHLLGTDRWEKVLDSIQVDPGPVNEGPRGALPIKDKRAFPPFREIEKILPGLRQAYLDAPPENHFFALKDIHKILATQIRKIFEKYMTDENLLAGLEGSAGYMLPAQMAANAKLPQYDPEAIARSSGLRSTMMPPSEIQTRVTKNFYKRLKKLEQWDAQYGDVHANNLMQRENGDLVVADVGLFMFGPPGSKGYAGQQVERLRRLAGLI